MGSLRSRLVAGILAGTTLLLGAGGLLAYARIKARLYAEFDRVVVQRATAITSWVKEEAGAIRIEWLDHQAYPPGHEVGNEYFAIWNAAGGERLAASPDLDDRNLARVGGSGDGPEIQAVVLPGNRPGRAASLRFYARLEAEDEEGDGQDSATGGPRTARRAPLLELWFAKVDPVAPTLAAIRRLFTGLWLGCAVLGGVYGWLIVRHTLRPLDQLQAQIGGLVETVSGQRIALAREPAELRPVTRQLNHLLARIEAALARERRLTSNVAHELRTPIAGILSTLEVTLARERPAAAYREALEEAFAIAQRMHWLVNNLLSITRPEAGQVRVERRRVVLEEALTGWWEPFARRAEERGLRIRWEIDPGAAVETDPEFLRVIVTNLFDNAVSHTPEGGTIRITAGADGNITVANPAGDFDAGVTAHVFDPLWRRSESREEVGVHAGLGLHLCRKITELLGGRIGAEFVAADRLFIVRLELAESAVPSGDGSPPPREPSLPGRDGREWALEPRFGPADIADS